MDYQQQPFIGSEALAAGDLSRHELRAYHFDLARRGPLGRSVASLDALAAATDFKVAAVEELAARHRHTRGLRQLNAALDLVDGGAQSRRRPRCGCY